MPSVEIDFTPAQLEETETYARRHQLSVAEVVSRALDRFLALACIEPDDVSLMVRDGDDSPQGDILGRDR